MLFSVPAGNWPNTGGNSNIVPVVANGQVYVASWKQLAIFGLKGTGASGIAGAVTSSRAAAGDAPSKKPVPVAKLPFRHVRFGRVNALLEKLLNGKLERKLDLLKRDHASHEMIDLTDAFQSEQICRFFKPGDPIIVVSDKSLLAGGMLSATAAVRAKDDELLWAPVSDDGDSGKNSQ